MPQCPRLFMSQLAARPTPITDIILTTTESTRRQRPQHRCTAHCALGCLSVPWRGPHPPAPERGRAWVGLPGPEGLCPGLAATSVFSVAHICRLSSSSGGRKPVGQCGLTGVRWKEPSRCPWAAQQGPQGPWGSWQERSQANGPEPRSGKAPCGRMEGPTKERAWPLAGATSAAAPGKSGLSLPHTSFLFTHHGQRPAALAGDSGPKWVDSGLKDARCPGAASVPYMQSPLFSGHKWQSCLSAPTCGAEARLVHLKDHSSPPQFINQACGSLSAARRSEPTSP